MSPEARDEGYADGPPTEVATRLGYLLKHAQLRFAELSAAALAPHDIDGREFAVLLAIDAGEPPSQYEAARRLGIDRTSMVALLDSLEAKGLVGRRRHTSDRRRNIVELSARGRAELRRATAASDEAERLFLSRLSKQAAAEFRRSLSTLVVESGGQSDS